MWKKRVKRLEWWNRLLVLGMASLLAYGFTTQVVPAKGKIEKIVRAERLEIMGQHGEPAAILGFDDEGAAGLFINDPGGSMRVALAHDSQRLGVVHPGCGGRDPRRCGAVCPRRRWRGPPWTRLERSRGPLFEGQWQSHVLRSRGQSDAQRARESPGIAVSYRVKSPGCHGH